MKSTNRKNWSKMEDRQLVELANNYEQPFDWEELAVKMQQLGYSRNAKQIKSRWNNNLSPNLVKEKWAKTDILKLFILYDTKGNRWQEIASQFSGRTDNCIKNQLFSSVRKGLRSIVKELGLETGYSYTAMINQIKPKILANFLLQKLSIKTSVSNDEVKEATASDLIKTYIFKSKQVFETDPIYEKKEVIQAFLQILINMNSDYISNKKVDKPQIDNKIFNKSSDIVKTDHLQENLQPEYIYNKLAINHCIPEEYQESIVDDPKLHDTDKIIDDFKEVLKSCDLKNNIVNIDHLKIKEQYVSLFQRLGHLSDILITKLSNLTSNNQEDVEKVRQFINCISFTETNFKEYSESQKTVPLLNINRNTQNNMIPSIYTPSLNNQNQMLSEIRHQKPLLDVKKIFMPKPLQNIKRKDIGFNE